MKLSLLAKVRVHGDKAAYNQEALKLFGEFAKLNKVTS